MMRRIFPALFMTVFVAVTPLLGLELKDKLTFTKIQAKGKISLYVANTDQWAPIHLKYDLTISGNCKFSTPLPARVVVRPGQKVLLGDLVFNPGSGPFNYQSKYECALGDPDAVPDPNAVYLFPYGHGVKHRVVQGYFGQKTHQTCRCLDFDLALNSPVCAARDGLVVDIKQDSNVHGLGPEFKDKANHVVVLHSDGTWAHYGHLVMNGARVHLGQKVKAGQVIGLGGNTGQSSGPHLHFEVDRADWDQPSVTLSTLFLLQDGTAVEPEEGKYYYSYHPDGPAFKEVQADSMTEDVLEKYSAPAQGPVTIRCQRIDDRTFVYGSNGTNRDSTLTISFPRLNNLSSSKLLPYTKVIPAGREVYLLTLDPIQTASFSFSVSYSYK